jgi:hypothetical protein
VKTAKISPLTGLKLVEYPTNGRGDVLRWKQRRAELLIGHTDHLWDYISIILERGVDHDFGLDPSDISAEELAAMNSLTTARAVERCRRWEREVSECGKNKKKLYRLLLWNQCEDALNQRLENDQEYSAINAEQDPIRLWKKIEAISLQGSISTGQVKIVEDARRRFEGVHQASNETVAEFHRRFRGEINVMRSCGARLLHVPFLPEDPARRTEVQDQVLKEEDAISKSRLLTKLDKKRYGAMLDGLDNGTVLWPLTLEDAFAMACLRQEGAKTVGTLVDYRPSAQAMTMVATASAELKRTKKGKE